MNFAKYILLIYAVIFNVSCSSISSISQSMDWVEKVSMYYPSELYLTSLGIGDTKEAADNNAYKGIAKIFGVEISSTTNMKEAYSKKSENLKVSEKSTFNIDERLKITMNVFLENITIDRTGFDSESKKYYSLAVLQKKEFSDILISKIQEKDQLISQLAAPFNRDSSKFLHFKSLLKSHILSLERLDLYQKLRIVYSAFSEFTPAITAQEIESKIKKFSINDFKIGISFDGNFNQELERLFSEFLGSQSIFISQSSKEYFDLMILGSLKIDEVLNNMDKRFYSVRWSFSIEILDTESDRIVFSDLSTGKQTHASLEQAHDRVFYKFKNNIVEEVSNKILNTFFK